LRPCFRRNSARVVRLSNEIGGARPIPARRALSLRPKHRQAEGFPQIHLPARLRPMRLIPVSIARPNQVLAGHRGFATVEGRMPLGLVEHCAGSFAFVGSLVLGSHVIDAVASRVYAFWNPGGFMKMEGLFLGAGVPPAAVVICLGLVAGVVIVFDLRLLNSRHRLWMPPLLVGVGIALFAWMTSGGGPRHTVSPSAAAGIGVSIALPFSAWWFAALAVAHLRRRTLQVKASVGRTVAQG